ncbi:MAG TPA: hypothetical protein VM686_22960 [Polyangiaceae bacterium]|nr:hypothetical protein [Polyangiaceae bacterium]
MNESEPLDEPIRPGLLLALLLVVVAVVYAPALGAGYLFDDREIVISSPLVERLHPLAEYFSRPFFTSAVRELHGYYRPLVVLSFALDYRLHDGAASGLHLTNLVLHLINTALFVFWLRRRGSGAVAALALAGLWALHPRLTEAASWISGRTDVMATTFVLAALVVWQPTAARRAVSALLLLAGLLAKETALAGIVALCCCEWAEQRRAQSSGALGRAAWHSLPFLVALGAYIGLRLFAVGFASGQSLGFGKRALAVFEAVGRYACDLALPWFPDAVQGRIGRPTLPFVALGALTLLLTLWLCWRQRHRLRAEDAAPAALALVGLGLTLHVVPIPSRMISADRFLYLPLIGLLALAAPTLERLWRVRPLARLSAAVLLVSFGVFAFRRSSLWANELAFWVSEYRQASSVERYVPATELAASFLRTGLYEPALKLSQQGIETGDPSANGARYNAALALARLGRTSEARGRFEELARDDRRGNYATALALVELQERRFDAAGQRLLRAFGPQAQPSERALLARVAQIQAGYERLQADQPFAASANGLVLRAELASEVQRLDEAVLLWSEVAAGTRDPELARKALARLIRLPDPAAARTALAQVQARFGAMPELDAAFEVRRAELDAAEAAARDLEL